MSGRVQWGKDGYVSAVVWCVVIRRCDALLCRLLTIRGNSENALRINKSDYYKVVFKEPLFNTELFAQHTGSNDANITKLGVCTELLCLLARSDECTF